MDAAQPEQPTPSSEPSDVHHHGYISEFGAAARVTIHIDGPPPLEPPIALMISRAEREAWGLR